jgi:uncharacterized membrane protein (DUF485 family)
MNFIYLLIGVVVLLGIASIVSNSFGKNKIDFTKILIDVTIGSLSKIVNEIFTKSTQLLLLMLNFLLVYLESDIVARLSPTPSYESMLLRIGAINFVIMLFGTFAFSNFKYKNAIEDWKNSRLANYPNLADNKAYQNLVKDQAENLWIKTYGLVIAWVIGHIGTLWLSVSYIVQPINGVVVTTSVIVIVAVTKIIAIALDTFNAFLSSLEETKFDELDKALVARINKDNDLSSVLDNLTNNQSYKKPEVSKPIGESKNDKPKQDDKPETKAKPKFGGFSPKKK